MECINYSLRLPIFDKKEREWTCCVSFVTLVYGCDERPTRRVVDATRIAFSSLTYFLFNKLLLSARSMGTFLDMGTCVTLLDILLNWSRFSVRVFLFLAFVRGMRTTQYYMWVILLRTARSWNSCLFSVFFKPILAETNSGLILLRNYR